MGIQTTRKTRWTDWLLAVPPLIVLLIYVNYTFSFLFAVPYPGMELNLLRDGWLVSESVHDDIASGDYIIGIGSLTLDDFMVERMRVPFQGLRPGDEVVVTVNPGERSVLLTMPEVTGQMRFRRLVTTLGFLPFWLAGTAVLLLLRPRNKRWLLLVAFFYLLSLWLVLGPIINWQVGYARAVYGVVQWALVPVTIHLHLTVPSSLLKRRWQRPFLFAIYVVSGACALLDLFQILPRGLPVEITAILISILIILYRIVSPKTSLPDRIAARLMFAGISIAFLPGILWVLLSMLFGQGGLSSISLVLAYLALPALPLLYIYALYKRQLGTLEFRTNRLLSGYSFVLVLTPIVLFLLLVGLESNLSPIVRTGYLLLVSLGLVIGIPPLARAFDRVVNRLAYGTIYEPGEILAVFADSMPMALSRDTLRQVLAAEILPSLLVRESAVVLFKDTGNVPLSIVGLDAAAAQQTVAEAPAWLAFEGQYIPPHRPVAPLSGWVRLSLPLRTRETTLGVWLLGRRDPDDFYPQSDIELLQSLANQMAPVIENVRLYETLRSQADLLAEQVAVRTAELREERDRTQAILDNAGEGILFADEGGSLLYVNPAMCALSGFAAGQLLGKPLMSLFGPQRDSGALPDLQTAVAGGQEWSGELQQRARDGSLRDVQLTLAPSRVRAGQVHGFVGVVADIGKLKEIDRLKSNLIANVSHELKTPLTNIRMYLSLLERGKPERSAEYLDILNRETARLTQIIQDLLDLSQLESGSVPTVIEALDLRPLLADVVQANQQRAAEHACTLVFESPPDVALTLGDARQLERVMINLIVNALHYTPAGGTVRVTAGTCEVDNMPAVFFKVTDTGYGIPEHELPHLFDRFYRGYSSRESNAPGTGLGLAICKEIIDQHAGWIDVTSSQSEGTTFTVCLRTYQP